MFEKIMSFAADIQPLFIMGLSVFTLYWNYNTNMKHKIFLEKLNLYREYITLVSSSANPQKTKEEMELNPIKLLKLKQEIILVAPDEIINCIVKIGELDLSKPEKSEIYFELLTLMRQDLLKNKSKISKKTVSDLIA